MRLAAYNPIRRRSRQTAMTLLELMVAMSILTFIVFGLYSMFDKTQKAFLNVNAQVDIHEPGRAVMEMMVRDLEQMRATGISERTNLWLATITNSANVPIAGFHQRAMVGGYRFTNQVQEFFFYTKTSQWNGIAYLLQMASTNTGDSNLFYNLGIGSLQRYATNVTPYYLTGFDPLTNYLLNPIISQRVADGVIHLALRAYDQDGNFVDTSTNNFFTNGFVPAYVELEVGMLEPKIWMQARSIPDTNAQRNFLQETTNRASAVHLFRQIIPVRTAN